MLEFFIDFCKVIKWFELIGEHANFDLEGGLRSGAHEFLRLAQLVTLKYIDFAVLNFYALIWLNLEYSFSFHVEAVFTLLIGRLNNTEAMLFALRPST